MLWWKLYSVDAVLSVCCTLCMVPLVIAELGVQQCLVCGSTL
jgi:hypothetical protein